MRAKGLSLFIVLVFSVSALGRNPFAMNCATAMADAPADVSNFLAKEGDIAGILSIQEYWNIANIRDLSNGFLVHVATKEALEDILHNGKGFVMVRKAGNNIKAFMVSHSLAYKQTVDSNWLSQIKFYSESFPHSLEKEKVLFLKLVARGPSSSAIDVVSLEKSLFHRAQAQGYTAFIGEIALEPRNNRSLRFHLEKQNFQLIGEYLDYETNMKWGIVYKKIH